jgi:hypothetical protein
MSTAFTVVQSRRKRSESSRRMPHPFFTLPKITRHELNNDQHEYLTIYVQFFNGTSGRRAETLAIKRSRYGKIESRTLSTEKAMIRSDICVNMINMI